MAVKFKSLLPCLHIEAMSYGPYNSGKHYRAALCENVYNVFDSHEVSDVAGLASFSFGADEVDRCVIVWKKVTIDNIVVF